MYIGKSCEFIDGDRVNVLKLPNTKIYLILPVDGELSEIIDECKEIAEECRIIKSEWNTIISTVAKALKKGVQEKNKINELGKVI